MTFMGETWFSYQIPNEAGELVGPEIEVLVTASMTRDGEFDHVRTICLEGRGTNILNQTEAGALWWAIGLKILDAFHKDIEKQAECVADAGFRYRGRGANDPDGRMVRTR